MSDIFHRPEYSKHEDMEEDDLVGTPYNGQLKDLGVSETRARTGAGFGAHHFSLSRYGGVNGAGNQVIDGSYHVGEDGTVYDNSFFLSDGSLSFANGCARGDHRHRLPGVGRRFAGGLAGFDNFSIRTLRAAVRHPATIAGCRAAVRGRLASHGSPRPPAVLAPLLPPSPLQQPPPPRRCGSRQSTGVPRDGA